jgi:hypothetical protein
MHPTSNLTTSFHKNPQKHQPGILSERLAIFSCGLLVALFAIPILVAIHTLSALFWGTISVFQLLNGKGLFNEASGL